jgi:hypothetical protein
MRKIPITVAEPGMVLAKPIINDAGMQLCAEETVLTSSLIARLQKMQITHVVLKGDVVDAGAKRAADAETVKALDARFAKIKNDPVMDKLKKAIAAALIDKEDNGASKGGAA